MNRHFKTPEEIEHDNTITQMVESAKQAYDERGRAWPTKVPSFTEIDLSRCPPELEITLDDAGQSPFGFVMLTYTIRYNPKRAPKEPLPFYE